LEAFPNARTSVRIAGYQLDIEEIEKTHISKIRIWPLAAEASPDGESPEAESSHP
jgi:Mg2+/Co2+ transporter CorB